MRGGGQLIENQLVELSYSGGKDSDVILHLAKMAGIKFNAVYKNTTIDPSGTIAHAKENGVIVAKPKDNFFRIIERGGLPNRWRRLCCACLKEYKIADVAIQGIRRDESVKRAKRYNEPNFCRLYSKKEKTHVWLPILEWTQDDIKEFVEQEGVKCHSLYYDDNGVFHPERRLGCIGCPLASRRLRLEQLKEYPLFVREYVKRTKIYRESQIEKKTAKGFTMQQIIKTLGYTENEYEHVCLNLFCDTKEEFAYKFTGMFGRADCKAFLEDYFKISLP